MWPNNNQNGKCINENFKDTSTDGFLNLGVGLPLHFLISDVVPFLSGYRSKNVDNSFFNNPIWLVMHLVGGTMALLLGPTQFWPFIRNKFLSFHRLAGKIYTFGVLLIGIPAFRLSVLCASVLCRISMFLLTLFAALSTCFAWKAIWEEILKCTGK